MDSEKIKKLAEMVKIIQEGMKKNGNKGEHKTEREYIFLLLFFGESCREI